MTCLLDWGVIWPKTLWNGCITALYWTGMKIDYLIDNLCYVNLAMFVKTGFVNGSVLIKQWALNYQLIFKYIYYV